MALGGVETGSIVAVDAASAAEMTGTAAGSRRASAPPSRQRVRPGRYGPAFDTARMRHVPRAVDSVRCPCAQVRAALESTVTVAVVATPGAGTSAPEDDQEASLPSG